MEAMQRHLVRAGAVVYGVGSQHLRTRPMDVVDHTSPVHRDSTAIGGSGAASSQATARTLVQVGQAGTSRGISRTGAAAHNQSCTECRNTDSVGRDSSKEEGVGSPAGDLDLRRAVGRLPVRKECVVVRLAHLKVEVHLRTAAEHSAVP
jgi:hypothetical protein